MDSLAFLESLYRPETFSQAAAEITGRLAEYLVESQQPETPTRVWVSQRELLAKAREILASAEKGAEQGGEPDPFGSIPLTAIKKVTAAAIATANRTHSPKYMGHQVCPPVPWAALMESLGSVINQPAGVYEMGAFPIAAERALIERLIPYLGWNAQNAPHADGIVTHGGSLANLTALLSARNVKLPQSWTHGMGAAPGLPAAAQNNGLPAIITSADSHYSVSRSAGVLGLGERQVIKAGIDEKRRMTGATFKVALKEAREKGLNPFCVVGSACTTSTGSFDLLDEIGPIARAENLWFHVDGAHGASFLLSQKHRGLLAGIEHADSVTWDAHKMMFVPSLCTFLFYRDRAHSYETFHQDAPYLFTPGQSDLSDFESSLRTVECTKRSLALAVYTLWAAYGPQVFAALLDRTIESTQMLVQEIQKRPDFKVLHDPECNILCFQYRAAEIDQMQLRKRLVEKGEFYITATQISDPLGQPGYQGALRTTVINPFTDRQPIVRLLDSIQEIGQTLLSQPSP